jgi:putative transposase
VATRLGVGPHTIGKWRRRFIADRIEGSMMRCVPVDPARSRMRRWPS